MIILVLLSLNRQPSQEVGQKYFVFLVLELLYEKLRYSLFKFSAVSRFFVSSASGSPTAATSSFPIRGLGICIISDVKIRVKYLGMTIAFLLRFAPIGTSASPLNAIGVSNSSR